MFSIHSLRVLTLSVRPYVVTILTSYLLSTIWWIKLTISAFFKLRCIFKQFLGFSFDFGTFLRWQLLSVGPIHIVSEPLESSQGGCQVKSWVQCLEIPDCPDDAHASKCLSDDWQLFPLLLHFRLSPENFLNNNHHLCVQGIYLTLDLHLPIHNSNPFPLGEENCT